MLCRNARRYRCALACLLLTCTAAQASYGILPHGAGIQSLGMGGISYTSIDDTYIASTNPALLGHIAHRLDFGMDYLQVSIRGELRDNAAGPDDDFKSDDARHFPIPQVGYVRRVHERVAIGFSAFSAGLGTDSSRSPYERFGVEGNSSLEFTQAGAALAVAVDVAPGHVLGLSLNPAYQTFKIEGIGPFAEGSAAPEHFSDRGRDDSFGISVTLGWSGELLPWLDAGLSFRSRTVTGRMKRYRGLLPEQGRLQAPAIWGGGLAVRPHEDWTLAFEMQRVEYGSEQAFANGIGRLDQGRRFGDDGGPGFGWRSQNIAKFGARWRASPAWTAYAGFSRATQLIPRSEAFFAVLAPGLARDHYTAGLSYDWERWAVNVYAAYVPRRRLRGRDSIPDDFGGGEMTAEFAVYPMGFSVSRRFR